MKISGNISAKVAFAIAIFAVLVMVIVLIFVAQTSSILRNKLLALAGEQQVAIAKNISSGLSGEVTTLRQKLEYLAQIPAIASGSRVQCQAKIEEVTNNITPPIGNLGRINDKGVFECSLNKALIGVQGNSLGKYVDEIFNDPEHKPVMSPAIKPPGANTHIVAVHVPVITSGKFNGTLGGAIYLDQVATKYLRNLSINSAGYANLFDQDFTILSHPNKEFIGTKATTNPYQGHIDANQDLIAAISAAHRGQSGIIAYRSGGVERLAAYNGVEVLPGRYWAILVVTPVEEIQNAAGGRDANNLLVRLAIITLLLILLGGVGAIIFTNNLVTKPLKEITVTAGLLASGQLHARSKIKRNDEIGRLANSFNIMADNLAASSIQLEKKVQEKTQQLEKIVQDTEHQNRLLEDTKKAVLNILEDLNEEKSKIEQEKIKGEALIKNIGEGLLVIDDEGKIVGVNPAAVQTLGYSEAELVGQWFPKAIPAKDESGRTIDIKARPIMRALSTGKSVTAQVFYVRKNGSLFPASVTVSPFIMDGKPVGAIQVFRDITAEHELERAKDEFVSLASHQLKTPATGVKAFVSMLIDGYAGKLTAKQMDFMKQIHISNERQLKIVEDLLHVARADSGRMVLMKKPFDLATLVKSVVTEQGPAIAGRNQKLIIDVPNTPITVQADIDRMQMVVDNLLSNASKYTPAGGEVKIAVRLEANWVAVDVSDTGVGIKKEDTPKLFKKFSRLNNPMSVAVGGTGLGLYLAKRIVDLHGGKIEVKSEPNKGSTFTVRLPVKS